MAYGSSHVILLVILDRLSGNSWTSSRHPTMSSEDRLKTQLCERCLMNSKQIPNENPMVHFSVLRTSFVGATVSACFKRLPPSGRRIIPVILRRP